MKVTARVIGPDVEDSDWSKEAREQLTELLPGVEVRNRVGSTLGMDQRGTKDDTDPIVGRVESCVLIGGEVIATLRLHDGFEPGHIVGITGVAIQEDGRIEGIKRIDCMGLDDNPRTCSWGEIIG